MYLEKNLVKLSQKYPQYTAMIRNTPITGRYAVQPSLKGGQMPNLIDRQLNMAYYNNTDPMHSAELDIIETKVRVPQVGIFLGFGLGYHLSAYSKLYNGQLEHLIIIERDPELLKVAFTAMDFNDIFSHPSVTLCLGASVVSFYAPVYHALNSGNSKIYLQALNFINITAAVKADMPYYSDSIKMIKDAVHGVIALYGNDPHDSLIGIQNIFKNINIIIDNPGIKDLKGAFKGKPGVVVSTGPSLDKNIHLVKEIEDKAVVVAADASLKLMLKRGLKPHLVTSLERVAATAQLFEGLTEEDLKDIYFSGCPVVRPETYANFPGKKIIVYRNFATFQWINIEKGLIDTGPSAGNMAYNMLVYLGCNPIILIGQDLSYAADKTHAEGTTFGTTQGQTSWAKDSFPVEGNYEPFVYTVPIWQMFKKHYEKDIAGYKGKVINATEGGAKIHGTELMTFQEAIDAYIKKPLNVLPTIRKKLTPPFPAQQEREGQSVHKKVVDAITYCESVISRTKTGAEKAQYALKNYYKPYLAGDLSMGDELAKAYKECEKCFEVFSEEKFFHILMHYVQSYFIKSLIDINAMRAEEDISPELHAKLLIKIVNFFENMVNLVEIMRKELNIMLSIIDERLK